MDARVQDNECYEYPQNNRKEESTEITPSQPPRSNPLIVNQSIMLSPKTIVQRLTKGPVPILSYLYAIDC
jgi:hypothetical protein